MHRAVFFDRDGVLNETTIRDGLPIGPVKFEDFIIVRAVPEELSRLKRAQFKIIVVTNQPEISRGGLKLHTLDAMHRRLLNSAPIDAIYYCPHDDRDGCNCRKPKPGMLVEAAREHDIDLGQSFMVGDRWRDTEAGKAVGCSTILIHHGYNENVVSIPNYTANNLRDAIEYILTKDSVHLKIR